MNFRIIYFDDRVSLKGKRFKSIIKILLLLILIIFTISFTPIFVRASNLNKSLSSKNLRSLTRGEVKPLSLSLKKDDDFGIPEPEFPKVSETDPSWYSLDNQPDSALNIVELWIGRKEYRVNGIYKEGDSEPRILPPGRTFVPIRFIAEGLGAEISWDGETKTVTVRMVDYKDRETEIKLQIGNRIYLVNGEEREMDSPPRILPPGRTFVPVRFIAEGLGFSVGWNGEERKVTVMGINPYSDSDYDTLSFKDEYSMGLNPNNPNTVYDSISDKQLAELIRKYPGLNVFLKYPDGRTKLTLNQKLYFEIDPRKPNNFNESVLDDVAIEYTKFVWENIYKKITKITKEHVLAEMKNLGEITYGKEIGKYLLQNLTMETIPVIDLLGEDLKRMQELGLMEKLGVELTNDYVKRVIQFEDGVIYTAGVLATLSDEFISENKDYINDLKKIKDLGFIAWVLNEYPNLTLEKQAELKKEYPQLDFSLELTFENPDGESGLSLEEKLKYGLNPTNPHNLDEVLNDKNVIDYVKLKGKEVNQAKQLLQELQNKYGEKLTRAMKELVREGKIKIEEMEEQGTIAKTQVEKMWEERAYKEGTSLEDLTSVERYKTLMFLNKTHGQEDINILLSQSGALQKAIKQENIKQFEDLIETLYKVSESNEKIINIKVKETTNFKKYLNQWEINNINQGELLINVFEKAKETGLWNEIKEKEDNQKLFLAVINGFGAYYASKPAQENQEFKEFIKNYAFEFLKAMIENKTPAMTDKNFIDYEGLIPTLHKYERNPKTGKLELTQAGQLWEEGKYLEAIQLLPKIEDLIKIQQIAKQHYHGVKTPVGTIDWLDPETAAAAIDLKLDPWPLVMKNSGREYKGIPYGQILEEGKERNVFNPKEMAEKLIYLLNPENGPFKKEEWIKVLTTEQTSRVEAIAMIAVGIPNWEFDYHAKNGSYDLLTFYEKYDKLVLAYNAKFSEFGGWDAKSYINWHFKRGYLKHPGRLNPSDPLNLRNTEVEVKLPYPRGTRLFNYSVLNK